MNIIYDGHCPYCTNFVQLIRLKDNIGEPVNLIDARSDDANAKLAREKYNLDDGMLVQFGGKDYYGAEAVNILSLLSTRNGVFNRIVGMTFRSKPISKILYPGMKFCRNITLKLLGHNKIGEN